MAPTTDSGAKWREVAAYRRGCRKASIADYNPLPPVIQPLPLNTISLARQFLDPRTVQITESPVEDLLVRMATGDIDAFTVTKAFVLRAILAQRATNCLTELHSDRALKRARRLDALLKIKGKPVGPLHGLPISVKEHIGMKGQDLNAGFVSWVGRVADEDAHILQILWKAGAVFLARTTQPQTLMHLETSNNIYGVTTNPFNSSLTCGGSSGGEGALIGFRGSCLGIGTDIGGSIRSPAANNGLYGLKPTSGRLPMAGLAATMMGEEHIVPTIGPISTSLEGCKIFTKVIIDAQPWLKEPSLVPLPWREEDFFQGKKLKIGVMWKDGVVKPHPPVTRALKQVVENLQGKENVEIVEWKPWNHDIAWEIIANLYFADGGREEKDAIAASGEPWRPLSKHIILDNPYVQEHTIASMWAATIKRDKYRSDYAEIWNKNPVDVILCPAGPSAAPKLDTAKWWGYTSQWNLLDYPALVFPVDKVDLEKDSEKVSYEPMNEKDEFNWKLWKKFGAAGYVDAPLSLQLVGRRFEDEKVIQALEIIQKEIHLPFVRYV